ncbi:MAG: hypothetical protein DWQ47_02235 [Acidobacteria bacterium]|nr:MAG: hypothetical protein DWQ32_05785 [Acidobacteriota bacterium]REK01239.1 MAG: hypothetical protein DWQ38_02220 [Acidobacteriota bacterium]REK14195.1 MAG: hypothetical protein DWQ43_11475 [Acidobacteriota bacterium]REK44910.1 MAG: hypothetical protein DWQ47_02235 [Acidobacteriota bacterium]
MRSGSALKFEIRPKVDVRFETAKRPTIYSSAYPAQAVKSVALKEKPASKRAGDTIPDLLFLLSHP